MNGNSATQKQMIVHSLLKSIPQADRLMAVAMTRANLTSFMGVTSIVVLVFLVVMVQVFRGFFHLIVF